MSTGDVYVSVIYWESVKCLLQDISQCRSSLIPVPTVTPSYSRSLALFLSLLICRNTHSAGLMGYISFSSCSESSCLHLDPLGRMFLTEGLHHAPTVETAVRQQNRTRFRLRYALTAEARSIAKRKHSLVAEDYRVQSR